MDSNDTKATDSLRAQGKSGASWFFWIAGLSVVNSIVAATGSTWGFMAGLGATQVIDAVALSIGESAKWFALTLDLLVAGVFVGLGVWAMRSLAAYVIGMMAYTLDAGIFLLAQDWIGVAFHGLVLFFLWRGFAARRALERVSAAPAADPAIEKAA